MGVQNCFPQCQLKITDIVDQLSHCESCVLTQYHSMQHFPDCCVISHVVVLSMQTQSLNYMVSVPRSFVFIQPVPPSLKDKLLNLLSTRVLSSFSGQFFRQPFPFSKVFSFYSTNLSSCYLIFSWLRFPSCFCSYCHVNETPGQTSPLCLWAPALLAPCQARFLYLVRVTCHSYTSEKNLQIHI